MCMSSTLSLEHKQFVFYAAKPLFCKYIYSVAMYKAYIINTFINLLIMIYYGSLSLLTKVFRQYQ